MEDVSEENAEEETKEEVAKDEVEDEKVELAASKAGCSSAFFDKTNFSANLATASGQDSGIWNE